MVSRLKFAALYRTLASISIIIKGLGSHPTAHKRPPNFLSSVNSIRSLSISWNHRDLEGLPAGGFHLGTMRTWGLQRHQLRLFVP